MIPNSFENELFKQAAPIGFLATLGKVLSKSVPSALEGIRGAGMAAGLGDIAKTKLVGSAAGALTGAYAGGNIGSEENKNKNRMLGAIAGGVAGSFGGKMLAEKLPSFGTAAGPALKALGTDMQAGKVTGKNILDYMSSKWAPKVEKLKDVGFTHGDITGIGAQPTAKIGPPGFKQTKGALGEVTHPAGKTLGAIGDIAQNIAVAKKGPLGLIDTLKGDWHQAKFTTKDVGGKNYLFERSGLGKVVNPALTSGLGMGALQAATVESKNGEKPSVGKRLRSGGGTALAWGTAPKLMMGKMLAYDVPKTLIGMRKPKAPEIPTTIN